MKLLQTEYVTLQMLTFLWARDTNPSQQTFTCPNSIIQTLEKGVKYVQSYQ